MAEIVTMPKLGFDMAEGTLVRWVKAEGDPVAKADVIAEIETDKATVEVESGFDGVMFRHLAAEGTALPVNAPIAVVTEGDETLSDEEIESLTAGEKPPEKGKPEDQAPTKQTEPDQEKQPEPEEKDRDSTPAGGVSSSPLARKMAEEHDIRLDALDGSGPQGRIVKKDVEAYLSSLREKGREEEAEVVDRAMQPLKAFSPGEVPEDELVDTSRLRQAISRRMQDSNQNFPHFYLTRAYDVGRLLELRKELNPLLSDDERLSVNDFIIKATALALRQYPNLNASIEDEQKIRRHGHVNIGVAVAVEGGLMTVVCKDADQKPLRLIAREIRGMAARARDGKVKNEDIQGSTFSISNLGMYGIENFAAIINPPEAGILAVSAAMEVPIIKDGQVSIGTQMKATLSADHRVTDGAEAAEFMKVLADFLEQPMRLLL